ncbi:hypothetical protein HKCCA1058_05890 [Rhodobacterales bacterium HKCCA1058]|nr:hypothetical protein [Rhodobacterales bacterium HKCCA1058]
MNTSSRIIKKILTYKKEKNEIKFNSARLDRRNFQGSVNKAFPAGDTYWLDVAKHIRSVAEHGHENFFRDAEVILHLASEDAFLGYELLKKIRLHPIGEHILNKCGTPAWGAPFILQDYPFVSPTTASHIANILSIYDTCGQEISSILDFGGGYGGFARCLATLDPKLEVNIFDLVEMQYVQKKYLNDTTSSGNYNFFSNIEDLDCINVDVFNASFSFSETPLIHRERIEKYIIQNTNSAHIIFQPQFNGIDNLEYMDSFRKRLESCGWFVNIKKYDWYGRDAVFLLIGSTKRVSSNEVLLDDSA